ncbi:DUF4326 domain-containing protein [Streptomyces anulatus]|uniref:DUF4326 domain-containing protein n=1 Tax=Streptomyces anulatus TaxID=1892 RepID=UPI002E0DA7D6|nr:DUF4326 domain-containing protein [Streptomyces anulatus]
MSTTTRIQRQRTRGWCKPDRCVIVDRTSAFGNPFTIAAAMDVFGYKEPEARATVIAEFGPWLRGSRANWQSSEADERREKILARLPELRGMDLACACAPGEPCHADVLLEWAALSPLALEVRVASARARVDRQRMWRGERPMYEADDLSDVLTQDVHTTCLVDYDPGDGIPVRCDNRTWNEFVKRQRMRDYPKAMIRLVEVFG